LTKGFSFGRTENPTQRTLEECVTAPEGGGYGIAFRSSLAAASAAFTFCGAEITSWTVAAIGLSRPFTGSSSAGEEGWLPGL